MRVLLIALLMVSVFACTKGNESKIKNSQVQECNMECPGGATAQFDLDQNMCVCKK